MCLVCILQKAVVDRPYFSGFPLAQHAITRIRLLIMQSCTSSV